MLKLVRSIVSRLVCRFRSRAVVELENLALRHQLHVLRRQRPDRLRLFAVDRLLWVWLYRLWPRCLEAMVLVKPATVIQWHRLGFRLFWRWRSRSGRPSVEREVRDLIRQMSSANPLWGAPRIHGELIKLGMKSANRLSRSTWCEGGEHLLRTGEVSCGVTPKESQPSTCSLWHLRRFGCSTS
jgi:putative transposase